jgi:hypothetical protein
MGVQMIKKYGEGCEVVAFRSVQRVPALTASIAIEAACISMGARGSWDTCLKEIGRISDLRRRIYQALHKDSMAASFSPEPGEAIKYGDDAICRQWALEQKLASVPSPRQIVTEMLYTTHDLWEQLWTMKRELQPQREFTALVQRKPKHEYVQLLMRNTIHA